MTPTPAAPPRVGGPPTSAVSAERGTRPTEVEVALGGALLAVVAVAALYFIVRPEPTVLDRWIMSAMPTRPRSGFVTAVAHLGSPFVLVAGSVAACLATVRRDPLRAVVLLVAPALAVAASDWIIKPVVGRTFDGVLCFPSGSVAAVTALAMVAIAATPAHWRWVTAALGGTVSGLMMVAVVALGWHYPTDAAAGLALGAGTVLFVDGAVRRLVRDLEAERPARG